jgi:exonuclease SbcC
MLERLVVTNFQAHDQLVIELDPHITTIVGPSDVGKSAVLRALRWLCLNQPSGDSFVKQGSPVCWVKLHVDGHVIVRKRGDKINAYKLDGNTFKSFGVGTVPVDIMSVLNLTDINFQGQIDPPFWFAETAGQVSKQLNQVVSLGAIDATLSAASSELRRAHAEVELTESRLSEATHQRDELAWVEGMDEALTALEAQQRELARIRTECDALAALLESLQDLESSRSTLLKAKQEGSRVVSLGVEWEKARGEREELETLLGELEGAEELVKKPPPDITPLLALRKECDKIAEDRRELEHFLDDLKRARKVKWRLKRELETAARELEEARSQSRICPTCGQPLPS